MERRAILAFVLMGLVLVVSQYLLTPRPPPEGTPPSPAAEGVMPPAAPDVAPPAPPPRAGADPAADQDRSAATPTYAAPGGGSVRVETPLYALTLDRRGGVVTGIVLKRFQSYVDSMPVQLVPPGRAFLQKTIRSGEAAVDLSDVLFDAERARLRVETGRDSLVLTGTTASGASARQVIVADAELYEIGYRLDAPQLAGGGALLETHLGPAIRSNEPNAKEEQSNFAAVARIADEVHTLKPGDVEGAPARFGGPSGWAGLKTKYFLAALLASQTPFRSVTISPATADTLPGLDVAVRVPFEGGSAEYELYLGPQEFGRLTRAAPGLEDVNQYGWSWVRWMIQPFAHLIVRILLWMHQYVPNYGVVLIVFGVLVRLLMWPLTQKSFESMQKMQALQPEMTRLRERYKNDPQRMQQEVMRLYRERGVNPLGGCLPNLLPLPILFALFFVFQNTIEFRGAAFAGWIQDLSRPDPYYVLPVLMGVTMFIQQKLSATAMADNPQMKLMLYFMPVFLTFIFLNLASGLVLYYTVSNVLTFVQQLLLRRKLTPAPESEPAAK
ncbi:MAG: membrane protein insertase YidC [Gemmatimonadota bacterium]